MAALRDTLGEPEQRHFMQLTGIHPRGVGVHTHRDALRYLRLIDLHRRVQAGQRTTKGPGLLGSAMRLGR